MSVDANFRVWEGVYKSLSDAPVVGPGFNGSTWHERALQTARDMAACVANRQPIDFSSRQRNALLPPIVAALLSQQANVQILDFGGGLGTGYLVLAASMPEMIDRVDYRVVDVKGICDTGARLFVGKGNPSFSPELPAEGHFDLVHASSVMQYIEDWPALLARIARYSKRYVSLADMFIGNFKTYAGTQNYYGSRIPHWFFNADDFIREAEHCGLKLILRTECDVQVLGATGPLPMDNYPEELRVARTSNLLFSREMVDR